MTPLDARLRAMIAADGPLPLSVWMALCLADPEHGYYTQRQPFGADGDFTTAPEISQLFGEMVGVSIALALDALPGPITLAEFGPGRGTLMRDVLRTLNRLRPGRVARVLLVEVSARLRATQAQALSGLAAPHFIDNATGLPGDLPLIVIGNEFFDALPLRQFIKVGGHWHERLVGLTEGELAFVAGPQTIAAADVPPDADSQPDGTIFEIAPTREAAMAEIAARIASQTGFGLFFDYGHLVPGFGDTLQAVRAHQPVLPLINAGWADITSHVDFQALAEAARRTGCVTAMLTQGDFLIANGLLERAGALGASQPAPVQETLRAAVTRLAAPDQMGTLFKVLAVASPGLMSHPFTSTAAAQG